MSTHKLLLRQAALVLLAGALAAAVARADDRGIAVQIDNDLFSGAHRDEDYSWGAAVSFRPGSDGLLRPLGVARERIASWVNPEGVSARGGRFRSAAAQVGVIAMTPETLRSADPLPDDRPFANLLYVSSAELTVLSPGNRARYSSLTVGVLGLDVAEELHRAIHRVVGDERPLGWQHQLSAGGEPTARYVHAEQWLLAPEVKLTAAGSAGFLTEASIALSTRWGRIVTPWWGHAPELADYTAAPLAPAVRFGASGLTELYLFAGARLKARAYNALLQGQFRDSEVRVHSADLARLQAEGWIGLASTINDLRVTYTLRYASREMTREPGARSLIWAGVQFEKHY